MQKLTGNPPTRRQIAEKLNEMIDVLTPLETVQLIPTTGGKIWIRRGSAQFDLSGFVTRQELIQQGILQ